MSRFIQQGLNVPQKEKKERSLPKPGSYTYKDLEGSKPVPVGKVVQK